MSKVGTRNPSKNGFRSGLRFISKNSRWIFDSAQTCRWSMLYSHTVSGPTVALAFCPAEYGVILAAAGGEGRDIWFFRKDRGEVTETLAAHESGLVAFCWAPAASPATLAAGPAARSASKAPRRLVSAAAHSIRIWRCEETGGSTGSTESTWSMREELRGRGSATGPAVRDVQWRPNMGIPSSSVAACFWGWIGSNMDTGHGRAKLECTSLLECEWWGLEIGLVQSWLHAGGELRHGQLPTLQRRVGGSMDGGLRPWWWVSGPERRFNSLICFPQLLMPCLSNRKRRLT